MGSELFISHRPKETRVALLQEGQVADILIERTRTKVLVGSIFKGKVIRVLPGMQAAFVDIGLDRAAFLYAGDIRIESSEEEKFFEETDDDSEINMEKTPIKIPIQDLVREGQFLMVQIVKAPLGTKGARITTHISLAGRFVVYMPTLTHIGVSRRIANETERERLKTAVETWKPAEGGVIVRTAAEQASEINLKSDMDYLNLLHEQIKKNYEKQKGTGTIHSDLDVELRAIRDIASENINRIVVDHLETYEKVNTFIEQFIPALKDKVHYHEGSKPLFDGLEIELSISSALDRKVWLKSGGYIVFDEAEALVVIDVNTGKFVGKKDLEDTILKTNLEAIKEVAQQLKVRNCGGIIIIDFIDMEKEPNKQKVLDSLREELNKDRAKTHIVGMSSLGLVEMTRKRTRPSLVKTLCQPCEYCHGNGYVKTPQTMTYEIFKEIEREGINQNMRQVLVYCHRDVADWIYNEESEYLEFLENQYKCKLTIEVAPKFHIEEFELINNA